MMPNFGMQPQIILLKEGTDTSQGKMQLISNINACSAVVDTVRTTLGPRGMDKLIYNDRGQTTISNDGATIMKLLDIVHPAAKTLVDVSLAQDAEVGDGTTSVVILAGEFLKEAKPFVEEGAHPRSLIKAFRLASQLAVQKLKELSVSLEGKPESEKKALLTKCASTTLNSKLVSGEKEFFSEMVVEAVSKLDPQTLDLKMIGIKKVTGGGLRDSFLVDGVAFKKTFSYAGFEQQPKSFANPKILLLNIELELKAEKENAEIRLDDPAMYQSIVDAEWNIIYDKLAKCVASGAQIVLSRLAIGDLGTQYFADRGIFCAGRVEAGDLERSKTSYSVHTCCIATMAEQTERSFQKQLGVTGGFKSKEKKAPGKSGHRYYKNVGLGFKTPREAIEGTYVDKKCPFTGDVSIRGRILSGVVKSAKMNRTIVVRRDYLHYIRKYARYEKRHTNVSAHLSPCFRVKEGDQVVIGQCRPLSKTVRFNVLRVIPQGSSGKKGFTGF